MNWSLRPSFMDVSSPSIVMVDSFTVTTCGVESICVVPRTRMAVTVPPGAAQAYNVNEAVSEATLWTAASFVRSLQSLLKPTFPLLAETRIV